MEIKNVYGSLFLTSVTCIGIAFGIYFSNIEYFALSRLLASLVFNLFLYYNYSKFIKTSILTHFFKLLFLTLLILSVYFLKDYCEHFFQKTIFNFTSILLISLFLFYATYRAYCSFNLILKK